MVGMTAEVHWPRPPIEGWTADDLDRLPDLPAHTELIDGSLVFVSPQRLFHMLALARLEAGLFRSAPGTVIVRREMSVRIGKRQRPEPDLIALRADAVSEGMDLTWYPAFAVLLVVEVISPESAVRDRERKPELYAAAGIAYYWLAEEVDGELVVSTFRLSDGRYEPSGVHRDRLQVTEPFAVDIDLTELARPR